MGYISYINNANKRQKIIRTEREMFRKRKKWFLFVENLKRFQEGFTKVEFELGTMTFML